VFKFKFICKSIRNKLILITGLGASLVVGTFLWNLASIWSHGQSFLAVLQPYMAANAEDRKSVV